MSLTYNRLFEETIGIYGLNEETELLDEAKFSILPRFKEDPQTKKIAEDLESGIALIKSAGVTDNTLEINKQALSDANKAATDAMNLGLSAASGVMGGLSTLNPLVGICAGVISHLIYRIFDYYRDKNNEEYCIGLAEKEIKYLDNLMNKAKGEEKNKIKAMKKKLEASLEEFKNKDKKKKEEKK